jgi:hypothetical protein
MPTERSKEWLAKLNKLQSAAKQGFDEVDAGKGIVLNSREAIRQFVTQILAELRHSRPSTNRGDANDE